MFDHFLDAFKTPKAQEKKLQLLSCVSPSFMPTIREIILSRYNEEGDERFSDWRLSFFSNIPAIDLSPYLFAQRKWDYWQSLALLTNLKALALKGTNHISNECVRKLTTLTHLDLSLFSETINDESVSCLTNVTSLILQVIVLWQRKV